MGLMNIQRFCHGLACALVFVTVGLRPALAETFSFSLNGLGVTETPDGDRIFRGSMTLDGERMPESQTFDFDLTHGERDDHQSLEMGLRNQGDSVLEAFFDLFDLGSRIDNGSKLDVNVLGDINPTDSELNIDFGENRPGIRARIKTPQGTNP